MANNKLTKVGTINGVDIYSSPDLQQEANNICSKQYPDLANSISKAIKSNRIVIGTVGGNKFSQLLQYLRPMNGTMAETIASSYDSNKNVAYIIISPSLTGHINTNTFLPLFAYQLSIVGGRVTAGANYMWPIEKDWYNEFVKNASVNKTLLSDIDVKRTLMAAWYKCNRAEASSKYVYNAASSALMALAKCISQDNASLCKAMANDVKSNNLKVKQIIQLQNIFKRSLLATYRTIIQKHNISKLHPIGFTVKGLWLPSTIIANMSASDPSSKIAKTSIIYGLKELVG